MTDLHLPIDKIRTVFVTHMHEDHAGTLSAIAKRFCFYHRDASPVEFFLPEEKEAFLQIEPQAEKYFRLWYGAQEFINNKPRWCLWLGHCSPAELRQMPECMKRVENVRNFRLASKSEGTRKIADKPTRFHVENMPEGIIKYEIRPKVVDCIVTQK